MWSTGADQSSGTGLSGSSEWSTGGGAVPVIRALRVSGKVPLTEVVSVSGAVPVSEALVFNVRVPKPLPPIPYIYRYVMIESGILLRS